MMTEQMPRRLIGIAGLIIGAAIVAAAVVETTRMPISRPFVFSSSSPSTWPPSASAWRRWLATYASGMRADPATPSLLVTRC